MEKGIGGIGSKKTLEWREKRKESTFMRRRMGRK